jgi:hypothetical protein
MLKKFVTKPKIPQAQKDAEKEKARSDPFTYKRRDPAIYNPANHLAILLSLQKSPGSTYKDVRQAVTRGNYGIPTEKDIEHFKDQFRFRSSEVYRPIRKGYEYKILKGP